MGKVAAFQLAGMQLWFNSSDHAPPHIHVGRRGQWEIRVYFLECTPTALACSVKWGVGPPPADRKAILAAVLAHRAALLLEWEHKVCLTS